MYYTIYHADTHPHTPADGPVIVIAADISEARRRVFAYLARRRDSKAAATWELNGCPLWAIRRNIDISITRHRDGSVDYGYTPPF